MIDFKNTNSIPKIVEDLIKEDKRTKQHMLDGVQYYNNKNEILQVDFREFYVNGSKDIDYNKGNFHIVNNFQKKLVDQKTGYINGKPIAIVSDNEELANKANELLGEKRHDVFSEWIKGASNKGFEGLHAYIKADGEFDYTVIPAQQLIFITDTSYEQNLVYVIRYYDMKWNNGIEDKNIMRAEVWDEKKTLYLQEDENGNLEVIAPFTNGIENNPVYHWEEINTVTNVVSEKNWGKVPFVQLKNNSEEMTDLEPIKNYVDALDIVSSGFINDLKDVQLAIWVLRGYEGESLAEFMKNLQHFKAINLSDSENSNAEPKSLEIPKEARVALMNWLEDKIYQIGQGVNESKMTGGSITNVVIKAMYSGLDIKANLLITKMKSALSDFMYFVVKYINERDKTNYDYKELKFIFNKSMIFNEAEIIESLTKSAMMLSKRTILANHPFVEDVEKELERLKLEEQEQLDSMGFDDNEVE